MFGPGETDEWGVQKSAAPPNRGEPAAQSCWVLWENGELWRLASRSATTATTLRPPTHLPIYPSICGVHHARLSSVAILARRGHACGRFAARRARITEVILPFANKGEYEVLPDYLREDIAVHFVRSFREVFDIVFDASAEQKQLH